MAENNKIDANSEGQRYSSAPSISLPKGGGAIRGIGEKFAANPVTGTGSMSVPIASSPGRSGFGPQLALSYDSGAGNSPFGFGWNLSLPAVTRKTDKGLPQYFDAKESDVFILSGLEDLVPAYREGSLVMHEDDIDGYRVRRYRPRIEGLFARIERWTRIGSPGDVHWRSISKDNVLTLYGDDADSRIYDPDDAAHIFSWLISETRDDKGNGLLYRYKPEDGIDADLNKANERNRGAGDDARRAANRYLKRIHYGNRSPLLDDEGRRPTFLCKGQIDDQIANALWMFEVVFDYGEHDVDTPKPNDTGAWAYRHDPFSNYRAGFEVRTTRLCQRVMMFHHFDGEPGVGKDCLVLCTDFTYSDEQTPATAHNPAYSFLQEVTQTGYQRNNDVYVKNSLPPLMFTYTQPNVQDTVHEIDFESLKNLPVGVEGATYQWTDLHGEGIPGILSEQAGAWFYKRNLSPLGQQTVEFGPLECVATQPNIGQTGGQAQFMDLAGDGQPDLVVLDGPMPGLYEHDAEESWGSFRPFLSRLNSNMRDPNLRFVDLDGDGHADLLISEDDAFVWHASLAEAGFGPARRVAQTLDEEKGPRVVFADGTQSIYLADLSGDGLTDIARIRNGEVCYWPNLGYGRFGAKVTMDQAPLFDNPDQFDHKRLRLADIDGSGTTDLIYLHRDGVRLYFNQSGNSWSTALQLKAFPRVDDVMSIGVTDLLGNGTACLVWSSPLPGDARRQMRYVNLMGDQKPHLLVKTINNLGAATSVKYASSTKFYLQDRQAGKPWITRLPFPVHVVERVHTDDDISRNRFVTRYAYHHGYFDGEEREFRGFGMVEQWDTEQFAALTAAGALPADNIASASHVPPVHSKTWFHTGGYIGRDRVSRKFENEYFREPGLTVDTARPLLLDDTVVPPGLTLEEEREACRALKGSMLRREVYAADGSSKAWCPYAVTEQSFDIRAVQPRGGNRHGSFFTPAREAISYHYERNPADPRIQHTLTLEVDAHGNVLKQVAIGYGRRETIRVVDAQGQVQQVPNPGLNDLLPGDQLKQRTALLTYTENRLTNAIDSVDTHRNPLPCETRTFELTGYTPNGPAGRYRASDFVEPSAAAPGSLRHKFTPPDVKYEDVATGEKRRRPIEWIRTLYRRDDLKGLLPLGELGSLALPGESYKLAFTPGLLTQVFQRPRQGLPFESLLPNPADVLSGNAGNRGGYLQNQALEADGRFPASDADDYWWISTGQSFFSADPDDSAAAELVQARQHFFLSRRYRDPFGQDAFVDLDANDLLLVETRDALGNRVTVDANDYRVLQPRLVSDSNRNQTEVAFDTLGMVVGTAVMGKPAPAPVQGDTLAGFPADLSQSQIDAFLPCPVRAAGDPQRTEATNTTRGLLAGATTRIVYDLDRYRRIGQPAMAATIARETHVSDLAAGHESRLQVSFSYSDGFGREIQKKIQADPGPMFEGGSLLNPRWVGSGWTIFNNKGKPVRQYEPFFSATYDFEFGVVVGVSPVLFYDPAERVVATLHPNHTFEKVVFDPWQQTSYDVNDTCAPRNAQTGNPRTDPDIGGYVAEYFKVLQVNLDPSWQTWHAQRIGGTLGDNEKNAAQRAAAHADTPTTAHFDALGRLFLTVARNRVACIDHALNGSNDSFLTRVELDIEGNQREVHDERKLPINHLPTGITEQRIVMRYAYDMLGNRIHQLSMEAGARWVLSDVAGKPIHAWDSRGHNFTTTYDALRRPVAQTVRGTIANGEAASDPRTLNRDIVVDKIEYGEPPATASQAELDRALRLNLRTRLYRHLDSAGVATNAGLDANGSPVEAYDFKGNLLRSRRRLARDYRAVPDWSQPAEPQLETEFFEGSTRYDALNRPIQSVAPHSSLTRPEHSNQFNIVQPVFNEANLLERVDVWLERAAEPTVLLNPANEAPSPVGVANIDYDAKGQRQRIDYKNGASTFYSYDPLTYRLNQLLTQRSAAAFPGDDAQPPISGWPGRQVQNLHYTYDPAGNITHIHDDAQQTIYFRNQRIEPSNDYTYDALYRLIQAGGREHLGQLASDARKPPTSPDAFNAFHTRLDHPGNGNVMGTYIERYVYDAVGNFLQMQHRGTDPAHAGWTRRYEFTEASLIEPGAQSNRLSSTTVGNAPVEDYGHDAHGNMLHMPQLEKMQWDYKDQLRLTRRQRVNDADACGITHEGEQTFYVYDASGQRLRKVCQKAAGLTEERIYLGGFEIFRRHSGAISANTATLERETLHVMDDKQRIALVETRTLDMAGDDKVPRQLIRYQFGNHLGSASLELDEQAQIISYEEYAPYGSSTYQAVRSQTETAKRYRYTGKERDEESGLYYHGARYYAPALGQWASADPASIHAGVNLYAYVSRNPVNRTDPDGMAERGTNISPMTPLAQLAPVTPKQRDEEVYRRQEALKPAGPDLPAYHPPDTRTRFERFMRCNSLMLGYAVGLPQNTTKALAGDEIPTEKIIDELPWTALTIATWGLTAISTFRSVTTSFPALAAGHPGKLAAKSNAIAAQTVARMSEQQVGAIASPELAQLHEQMAAQGVKFRGNFVHVDPSHRLFGQVRNKGGAMVPLDAASLSKDGVSQGDILVNVKEIQARLAAGELKPLTSPQQVLLHEMGHQGGPAKLIEWPGPADPYYATREAAASMRASTLTPDVIDSTALLQHAQENLLAAIKFLGFGP